jgi:hypothetical protein
MEFKGQSAIIDQLVQGLNAELNRGEVDWGYVRMEVAKHITELEREYYQKKLYEEQIINVPAVVAPAVVAPAVVDFTTEQNDFITKIESAGIDKLCEIYSKEFKKRLTNMKSNKIPLEKRKNIIVKCIMQEIVKGDTIALQKKILDGYFAPTPTKEKPNAEWVNDFVVGEDVLVMRCPQQNPTTFSSKIQRKGKITKINKKSVSVSLYAYNETDDLRALQEQTHGRNRLVWCNFTNDTKVVFDRNDLQKKGVYAYADKLFEEGERRVDYGN